MQERRRDRRRPPDDALVGDEARGQADDGRGEHAGEQRALHAHRQQDGHHREAEEREEHRPAVQAAERDERAGAGHDDARPLQADEGDQQADAHGNRVLEGVGDGRDELLAQADARREDEDEARHGHRAERDRPRHLHGEDDAVDEEEVVAHGRRDRDGIVREPGHQQRRHAARDARGHEHGAEVHARALEQRRLDEDDVGHRQEGRRAGEHLGADRRAVLGEVEQAVEHRGEDTQCQLSELQRIGQPGLPDSAPRVRWRARSGRGNAPRLPLSAAPGDLGLVRLDRQGDGSSSSPGPATRLGFVTRAPHGPRQRAHAAPFWSRRFRRAGRPARLTCRTLQAK